MNYLAESAAAAWQAYNAMEITKQRHITLLAGLENHYGSLERARSEETLLLDKLLLELLLDVLLVLPELEELD